MSDRRAPRASFDNGAAVVKAREFATHYQNCSFFRKSKHLDTSTKDPNSYNFVPQNAESTVSEVENIPSDQSTPPKTTPGATTSSAHSTPIGTRLYAATSSGLLTFTETKLEAHFVIEISALEPVSRELAAMPAEILVSITSYLPPRGSMSLSYLCREIDHKLGLSIEKVLGPKT